ncbi:MAG: cytochrome c [Sphingomonadales bacterium]|jgi:mono/diheme cytochrome c family protein|nr:cytochrome c [Sphingomonadales bacterium]
MKRMIALAAAMELATAAYAAQKLGEVPGERAPEIVYAKICGYCHGRNVGPIILGRQLPVETIKDIARHGRNGMPAFRPTEVTPDEMDALAQWISASKANEKEHGK